mgnify:CR=1 FL=1
MADMMKPYVRTSAGDNSNVNSAAFGKIAQSAKDESGKDSRMGKYNAWKNSIGDIEAEGDTDADFKGLVNRAAKRGLEAGAYKNVSTGRRAAAKELNPSAKQTHPKGKK